MKLITLVLFSSILVISGCQPTSTDTRTIADQQLDKINFGWKPSSVTLDGVSKDTYTNFKITFTGSQGNKTFSFTTDGRPSLSPWPSTGTFTFDATDPLTQLLRNDSLLVTYEITDTTLTIKFGYSIAGFQGRADSVKGQWVFILTKQ